MKYVIILFSLCIISLSACSDNEETSKYGEEFVIRLDETVTFSDGNSMKVTEIRDEFCCCLCLCVWEGQLVIEVETTNASGEIENKSFGSAPNQLGRDIFDDYVVSSINYLYDNEPDSLPLCEGEFDPNKVELIMVISKK
ncbi:MAG: hypothetical protein P1U56_09850 [Saprospiraceae bacterium]|nr:hypothetical protein [Saprospiraceae bacterium]